jgi:hypothetical protein
LIVMSALSPVVGAIIGGRSSSVLMWMGFLLKKLPALAAGSALILIRF